MSLLISMIGMGRSNTRRFLRVPRIVQTVARIEDLRAAGQEVYVWRPSDWPRSLKNTKLLDIDQ